MSVSRRVKTRTQACGRDEASKRLRDARGFLDLAELAGEVPGVAAANAVAQVQPEGAQAAAALSRLVALKNDAEYGLKALSAANRDIAVRQARKLTEFAEAVLRR